MTVQAQHDPSGSMRSLYRDALRLRRTGAAAAKGYGEAAAGGQGLYSCPAAPTRRPFGPSGALLLPSLRWLGPTTSLGRFADRNIRGGFSLWLWMAPVLDPPVGRRTGADRANRTPARIGDKVAATQQKTASSTASGWGSRPPSRFDRPSTADTSSRPTRRDQRAVSATRSELLPPGPPTAARSLRRTVPPTADHHRPRRPRRLRLVTEASPDPTLHAWVGSADQHPVA
jgi:hypothetical protein